MKHLTGMQFIADANKTHNDSTLNIINYGKQVSKINEVNS
jgi:hypothetical protein